MALVIAENSRFSSACSFYSMLISHSAMHQLSIHIADLQQIQVPLIRNKSIFNILGANPSYYEDINAYFDVNATHCYEEVGCSFSILVVMRNKLIVRIILIDANMQAEQK